MKKNPYTGKIVEYHILQSFPVTCLNRDDVGSPKTALIGGVPVPESALSAGSAA